MKKLIVLCLIILPFSLKAQISFKAPTREYVEPPKESFKELQSELSRDYDRGKALYRQVVLRYNNYMMRTEYLCPDTENDCEKPSEILDIEMSLYLILKTIKKKNAYERYINELNDIDLIVEIRLEAWENKHLRSLR